ncbi:MAG TPA: FAD-binding oxidoreductase [Burkholderiales bacterium]
MPATKKPKPPPGILVNDVHAQLSSARVFAIELPADLDGVRKAFELAKTEEKNICIAGGRHSMGGQPFAEDGVLIDTRKLSRVIGFDIERGQIEVESGIMWPQLLAHLAAAQRGRDTVWSFAQKQTGADRMTLGGSLSANIHGRSLTLAPFINDIESFRLLNARGDLLQCSRDENPELFRLAIGGYGLFGFVYSLTLRLVPRRKLERVVELRDIAGLAAAFEERIQDGFLFGEFQMSVDDKAPDYLNRGVFSCSRPVMGDLPMPDKPPRELGERDLIELLYLAHVNKADAFKRYSAYALSTGGQLHWSDESQMALYPEQYHREIDRRRNAERRSTEMLTEVLCERERLEAFMADVRATARIERLEIISAAVRLVGEDRDSFLAWARRPYACVSFNLHVEHSSSGTIRAGDQLRRLIDIGLRHGGSFYPAYHRHALRRQVDACFPQFQDFLKLKRKYDPPELFQSDWYRHYKRMYFG